MTKDANAATIDTAENFMINVYVAQDVTKSLFYSGAIPPRSISYMMSLYELIQTKSNRRVYVYLLQLFYVFC